MRAGSRRSCRARRADERVWKWLSRVRVRTCCLGLLHDVSCVPSWGRVSCGCAVYQIGTPTKFVDATCYSTRFPIHHRTRRPMLASKAVLLLLVVPQLASAAALFGRETRQNQLRQEANAAEATCAATAGTTAWWASGRLYKSWTPPGMAYRTLRKPLLSRNQRIGLALAGAAAGTSAARIALARDGPVAEALWQLGRATAGVGDRVGSVFGSFGERTRRKKEEREREAHRDWLRANAKPAKIFVQK